MSMTEILNKYTAGQTTLEETNAALAEMGAGIHLEPGKNELTAEETAAAKIDPAYLHQNNKPQGDGLAVLLYLRSDTSHKERTYKNVGPFFCPG